MAYLRGIPFLKKLFGAASRELAHLDPNGAEEIRGKLLTEGSGSRWFWIGWFTWFSCGRGQMDAAGDDSGNLGLMSVAKAIIWLARFGDICIIRCR